MHSFGVVLLSPSLPIFSSASVSSITKLARPFVLHEHITSIYTKISN